MKDIKTELYGCISMYKLCKNGLSPEIFGDVTLYSWVNIS